MSIFWKSKKVLVTGADGFIGSHLCESLLEAGADVRAFVMYNSYGTWGWLDDVDDAKLKEMEICLGDVRDPKRVADAVESCDIVLHLASLIAIPYSYHAPDSYVDTNIKGTMNVLNACRQHETSKMIHTSTSEVYGTALYAPIDEKHPMQPQSPYSASKIAADNMALSYYNAFDLPVSILRPFNTFGPRQSARAVIPTIISQIYSGKTTLELGDLSPTRDFNYVKNTAEAFMAIAEAEGTNGNVYNAGSCREISIGDLVDLIIKITGKDVKVVSKSERMRPAKSEVMRLLANSDLLTEVSGWKPRYSLEEGLAETCKWIEKNISLFKTNMYNI